MFGSEKDWKRKKEEKGFVDRYQTDKEVEEGRAGMRDAETRLGKQFQRVPSSAHKTHLQGFPGNVETAENTTVYTTFFGLQSGQVS